MRCLQLEVVTGFGFPLFGESFIEFLIQFACWIVRNVQQRHFGSMYARRNQCNCERSAEQFFEQHFLPLGRFRFLEIED
ncbi:hypothetical protein D3C81_1936670 [compost metagenome]